MIQAAQHITEVLSLPGIATEVADKVFWELAEAGTDYAFINFSITDEGPISKNGVHQYNTQVRIYAKSLTEGSRIGGVVKDEIKESSYNWKFRGMRSTYTDGEAKEAFIEINFEFKL